MIFSSTVLTVVAVGRVPYWVLLYNTKWEEGWKKMVLVIKGMCQWLVVGHQLHMCLWQAIFAVEVSFIDTFSKIPLWRKNVEFYTWNWEFYFKNYCSLNLVCFSTCRSCILYNNQKVFWGEEQFLGPTTVYVKYEDSYRFRPKNSSMNDIPCSK